MTLISAEELKHWWHVARQFPIGSACFWLGLFHDSVEDGYLSPMVLKKWPALDAITRRAGEKYADYITRVLENPRARAVKKADLLHNLSRNGGPVRADHRIRYAAALNRIEEYEAC